jgi:hypothetical protein
MLASEHIIIVESTWYFPGTTVRGVSAVLPHTLGLAWHVLAVSAFPSLEG